MKIKRVYIASPLFNDAELEENERINITIRNAGYETFLPQRDGFRYEELVEKIQASGIPASQTETLALSIIAHLDIYQVCKVCDATILNLNGRVPDEGAVSEGAMCFARGKPLVIYKNDPRTLIGGKDNPLVAGLTDFIVVSDIDAIPDELERLEKEKKSDYLRIMGNAERLFGRKGPINERLEAIIRLGKKHLL